MSDRIFANRPEAPRTGSRLAALVPLAVFLVGGVFVIDRQGLIAYKQIGLLNPEVLEKTILPLIGKLRQ